MAEEPLEQPEDHDIDGSNVYSHIDFKRARDFVHLSLAATVEIPWQDAEGIRSIFGYRFMDFATRDEHCRIFYNDKEIVVTFQSSNESNPAHWARNLNHGRWHPFNMGPITQEDAPFDDDSKLHPGFASALKKDCYQATANPLPLHKVINEACKKLTQEKQRPIHFTGHSAGAAMSVIQAAYMAAENEAAEDLGDPKPFDLGEIYTFGAPRVGNQAFRDHMRQFFDEKHFRFEEPNDPVCAWPRPEDQVYCHCGQLIALTKDGKTLDLKKTLKPGADSFSHVGLWARDKLSSGLYTAGSTIQAGAQWIAGRFVNPPKDRIDQSTGRGQWPNIENYHYVENYIDAIDTYLEREEQGQETDISEEQFAELEGELALKPRSKDRQPPTIVPAIEVTRFNISRDRQLNRIVRWFNIADKQLKEKLGDYEGLNRDAVREKLDDFSQAIQSPMRAVGNGPDAESAGRPAQWINLNRNDWFDDCLDKLQNLTNEIQRIPNMSEQENFMLDRVLIEMRRYKERVLEDEKAVMPR